MAVAVGSNGTPLVAVAEQPRRRGVRVLLAVVSGLMLSAAFPTLDLEPLAWLGLVPLLIAARGLSVGAAFGVGWLGGTVFYIATCYWVAFTIAHYTALPMTLSVGVLLLMSAALACYHGAFLAGVRWFERRGLPALWLAPPLWVTLEWLRGWFFIGFPWAALGYSQYRYHDLVQMVEVTGVYGLSALVVLFNMVVGEVLPRQAVRVRQVMPALIVLTVLVVAIPLGGRMRVAALEARPPAGSLRVAIVQGNVEQDHKWDPAYQGETLGRYRALTAAAAASEPKPDLVVWPETATPFFFQEPGALRDEVLELARQHGVWLLFGSPAFQQGMRQGAIEELNRAYLVSPEGREVATYDKIELVPFGEYVPFQSLFFFVTQVVHAVGTVVPGRNTTVFALPRASFGVLVCYEGVFPALTRQFIDRGADFLVNVTNDAWYGHTSAPYQHLAQATLRAIENRAPLVRSANTGISAFIESDGRARWQGPLFESLWHVEEVRWSGVRTFYTRYGDVFAWGCALASLAAFGYGSLVRRWRRHR